MLFTYSWVIFTISSDVPTHLDSQGWKSWLLGHVDCNGQLQEHEEFLCVVTLDIHTAADLIWRYLLHLSDPTPAVVNPEQHEDIHITNFPLCTLFSRSIGNWSM